jgi:hypothetical protein
MSVSKKRRAKLLETFFAAFGVIVFCSGLLYGAYLDGSRPRSKNDALGFVARMKLFTGDHFLTEREKMIMTWLPATGVGFGVIGAAIRQRRMRKSV